MKELKQVNSTVCIILHDKVKKMSVTTCVGEVNVMPLWRSLTL